MLLLDKVNGIAYNNELKLLVTGSDDKSIKLHLFNEEKKEFSEVQHLKNIHSRTFFILFFTFRKIFCSNNFLLFLI